VLDAVADISPVIRRYGCSPTRSIRASPYDGEFDSIAKRPGMLERTVICDGASKTWAMTGWRIGFAANRILAPGLHQMDHQYRLLCVANFAMGRGGGGFGNATCGRRDAREFSAAPQLDRRIAQFGSRA
jgi:hypothetical protein